MQTRKDLLQAHRLMTQRAALALMLGQPDNPELPMRRLNVALISGVMVAVLVAAIAGIWGLIRPGGGQVLRRPGTLIMTKDSGTPYVWCRRGELCPVANYSSARLLADGDQRTVSSSSLSGFRLGPLIGIPGAPDSVPAAEQLVKTPWSVCVRTVDSPVTGRLPVVTLVAGSDVGGRRLRDDRALVVTADGQPWLLWRDRRLRVSQNTGVALTAQPTQTSGKWLNALTPGVDYAPPRIPDLGAEVPSPRGTGHVGQVFSVAAAAGADTAWYVLLRDGLARITETEGRLLLADPQTRQAYPDQSVAPIVLNAATAAGAAKSARGVSSAQLPPTPPTVEQYNETTPLCATYDDPTGSSGARLTIGGRLPPPETGGGPNAVDQLAFPPGRAALAGVLPGTGQRSAVTTYFLVTEGRRFALKSPQVAASFGYDLSTDSVPIPAGILGMIPNGPILDPVAAQTPISATGQSPG